MLFDRFDRYTMTLSHSRKRPDLLFSYQTYMPPPPGMASSFCALDCMSLFSGLSTTFSENPLPRGDSTVVVRDRDYVINPNDAFRASSGKKYVPYPRFATTYTWRNHLQVNWDSENGVAFGLGGAIAADSDPSSGGDRTASVSSPWITDDAATAFTGAPTWDPSQDAGADGRLVRDQADFLGDRSDDHDPIALPLLVDAMVWPDNTQQIANAANLFHIAYVGPNTFGYYNNGPGITTLVPFPCTRIDWPYFRVHTTGGTDANTQNVILVEPDLQTIAIGGTIKDCGLGDPTYGLFSTKPGDDHTQWAQIDLVRKVSFVTFGFFDTLLPNQHDLAGEDPPLPGIGASEGRPDFSGFAEIGVRDMISIMDPPIASQPGGTRLELQFRGIQVLPNTDGLYDPLVNDKFDQRKNLLNPNYACEAFRYAMPNPGGVGEGPRVIVEGITPYVQEDEINTIRSQVTGLMPRFINMRLVMENNIFSSPTAEPSLRSLMIVYRMGRPD